jgi:5-(carboxyamino)imidazole ribonucleotide mutase
MSAMSSTSSGPADARPLVAVIMGSKSDWETMRHADETLTTFGVPHVCEIVSAHRTPGRMAEFAAAAESRGIEVVIAGAGGAAHLPGMVAAQTTVPVLGVPVESHALKGLDSLLSIVQMPGGVPVGTLAIGKAGATNAALLAVAILANSRPELRGKLKTFRDEQSHKVMSDVLPSASAEAGRPGSANPPNAVCTFCGRPPSDVGPLVEGPFDVYICANCVELSSKIVQQEREQAKKKPGG